MSMTDIQRSIRRTHICRRALVAIIILNALTFAIDLAAGSSLVFMPPVLTAAALAVIVMQTRLLGTLRQRERELNRSRMTPEDWRQLREMEAELGWEPTEMPAEVAEPDPVVLGNGIVIGHIPDGAITSGVITPDMIANGSEGIEAAVRWLETGRWELP